MSQRQPPSKVPSPAPPLKRATIQRPTAQVKKTVIPIQVEVVHVERPESNKQAPTMSTAEYDNWEGKTMPPLPPMFAGSKKNPPPKPPPKPPAEQQKKSSDEQQKKPSYEQQKKSSYGQQKKPTYEQED